MSPLTKTFKHISLQLQQIQGCINYIFLHHKPDHEDPFPYFSKKYQLSSINFIFIYCFLKTIKNRIKLILFSIEDIVSSLNLKINLFYHNHENYQLSHQLI